MILLRSVLYFIVLLVVTLFFGILIVLLGWLPTGIREWIGNSWAAVSIWLLRIICGLGYEVAGRENLPPAPAIIMSKHQSAWETIALRSILRGKQSWVLKRELMWVPVFGWALAFMRPIAIDRKAGRRAAKQVIDQGIAYLKQGRYVIIFPEGTRTAPGARGRYGIGGALLAEHADSPLIPIAHNAGVFWRRRGLKKYPGTIQVVIGPPIPTAGRKASAIARDVENWIEAEVEKLPQGSG